MTNEYELFGNEIPPERTYEIADGKAIKRSSLRDADSQTQMAAMENWFWANYENPADNTPYIGSEGGYQFIHGGPFDAREELEGEFANVVTEEAFEQVVQSIERDGVEWAPKVWEYDPDLFESITVSTEQYREFRDSLLSTQTLATENIPFLRRQHLYRLLYVSIIIAFESYLCDTFIANVCSNEARLRRFVENDRHFSKQTMLVGNLFKRREAIEDDVRNYLFNLLWHRISDASRLFLETLSLKFPNDLSAVEEAIRVRHSIVHHGGKKDGKVKEITKEEIAALCQIVHDVVWSIESQLHPEGDRFDEDYKGFGPS